MKFVQIDTEPPVIATNPTSCLECPFNVGRITCRLYKKPLRGVADGRPDWCFVAGISVKFAQLDPRILNI